MLSCALGSKKQSDILVKVELHDKLGNTTVYKGEKDGRGNQKILKTGHYLYQIPVEKLEADIRTPQNTIF